MPAKLPRSTELGWGNSGFTPPAAGLLPSPHVQFWQAENSWRLGSSHRGGYRRDIPRGYSSYPFVKVRSGTTNPQSARITSGLPTTRSELG
jgi:hypothetical protein